MPSVKQNFRGTTAIWNWLCGAHFGTEEDMPQQGCWLIVISRLRSAGYGEAWNRYGVIRAVLRTVLLRFGIGNPLEIQRPKSTAGRSRDTHSL